MKKVVRLEDALVLELNDLYQTEKKLQEAIPICLTQATSTSLQSEMQKYWASSSDKLLKMERVFSYLMTEPSGKKNMVINSLLSKTHQMFELSTGTLRDVLLVSCLRTICYYKIAGYETATALAEELGLETPCLLLDQALSWEKETDKALSKIAMQEVNLKALSYT